jgi:hypothetical protein
VFLLDPLSPSFFLFNAADDSCLENIIRDRIS